MADYSKIYPVRIVIPSSAEPAHLEYTKMLFLVSHGLQTPLSAIRWGCGRLKRTAGNLTQDQLELVEDLQQQTRILASMFDWLLLLAKVDEGVHISTLQQLFLCDFLESPERQKHLPRECMVSVTCPDSCMIKTDRVLFASIVDALFLAMVLSTKEEMIPIAVETKNDMCTITFEGLMQLSILEEQQNEKNVKSGKNKIVGGIPGFLLAVAASLAKSLNGSLESAPAGAPDKLIFRFPVEPVLIFDV